jgi:putative FmdB family regulatory protein
MPLYEFRCESCGHRFEVRRGFGEAGERAACPDDGGVGVRLFSAPMLNVPNRSGSGDSGPSLLEPEAGYGRSAHHDHGDGHGHGGHGHSHGPGTAPHSH